jgi:hypothetical protein
MPKYSRGDQASLSSCFGLARLAALPCDNLPGKDLAANSPTEGHPVLGSPGSARFEKVVLRCTIVISDCEYKLAA